eukprot:scaffold1390_cov138-Cylindrotheca_fusiformis.AAC.6
MEAIGNGLIEGSVDWWVRSFLVNSCTSTTEDHLEQRHVGQDTQKILITIKTGRINRQEIDSSDCCCGKLGPACKECVVV